MTTTPETVALRKHNADEALDQARRALDLARSMGKVLNSPALLRSTGETIEFLWNATQTLEGYLAGIVHVLETTP